MKYLLVNDIHLSDKAPASCTDTYLDDLFDLLEQVAELAQSLDASIILAGDIFHHKTPVRTSHRTVMRLIDWARQALVQVYVVPGNHDLQNDRFASLFETQPLGVLCASGAVELLAGWSDDGEPIYGMPWQMSWDLLSVHDALAEWRTGGAENQLALVVTHAPLYPPGRELKFEYFPVVDFAEAMNNQGTVHYGHVHEPHGIYQVGAVTFSNPGALSRGSLHEHNLNRTPSIAIWDSNSGLIEHRELKARPADQVFHLQQAAEKKSATVNLNRFLESVQATRLDVTSTASVVAHVRETQPAEVAKVVETLLGSP